MKTRFDDVAEQLAPLNLQIKHDMEQAEAKAERVNELVRELATSGLLTDQVVLGAAFEQPGELVDAVGHVSQAALLVPEGFGICLWQAERYAELRSAPEDLARHARAGFQTFAVCSPVEKRLLLPLLDEMLEDLTDIAMVAASKFEPDPAIPCDEYFSRRDAEIGRERSE